MIVMQLIFAIKLNMAIFLVALGNSSLSNEGHVKIFDGESWSMVISNTNNRQIAAVACRELGFPDFVSFYVTPNVGFYAFKNITCQGDEQSLTDCNESEEKYKTLTTAGVLGVICEPRE